jgi:hypothetical protein
VVHVRHAREGSATRLDDAQFAELRRMLRDEQEKLLPEAARKTQPAIDANARRYGDETGVRGFSIKVGEPMILGILEDLGDRIATGVVVASTTTAEGESTEEFVAAVAYMMIVKQRLVFLTTHTIVASPADIEGSKVAARRWAEAVAAANRRK